MLVWADRGGGRCDAPASSTFRVGPRWIEVGGRYWWASGSTKLSNLTRGAEVPRFFVPRLSGWA